MKVNLDYATIVQKYIELRAECKRIEQEANKKIAELKQQMNTIELWLTAKADADGLKTIPTPYGTAYWSTHYSCTVASPADFMNYVREHEAWNLLEVRASKLGVKAYIDEVGEIPAGVNFGARRVFNLRENKD